MGGRGEMKYNGGEMRYSAFHPVPGCPVGISPPSGARRVRTTGRLKNSLEDRREARASSASLRHTPWSRHPHVTGDDVDRSANWLCAGAEHRAAFGATAEAPSAGRLPAGPYVGGQGRLRRLPQAGTGVDAGGVRRRAGGGEFELPRN